MERAHGRKSDHGQAAELMDTMSRIGIHQPNYAPWLGYFAKIASVDEFVFMDNCQMPIGRSYVSRVQVRGREGAEWMSVPVRRVCGEPINAVRFADTAWPRKHLTKMQVNYGRCPFFEPVMEVVRPIYEEPGEYLAAFNIRLIRALAAYLGLSPGFHRASGMAADSTGTHRLINLVRDLGGTTYVSGLGGTNYQDPAAFQSEGIELDVRIYRPVPYKQLQGEFVPGLSALDALFHLGPEVRRLLEYPRLTQPPACSDGPSRSTFA